MRFLRRINLDLLLNKNGISKENQIFKYYDNKIIINENEKSIIFKNKPNQYFITLFIFFPAYDRKPISFKKKYSFSPKFPYFCYNESIILRYKMIATKWSVSHVIQFFFYSSSFNDNYRFKNEFLTKLETY